MKQLLRILYNWVTNLETAPLISQDIPKVVIGKTRQGRAIHAFHFGTGPTTIVFGSGIHGNEVGTVKLAHHLIRWLATNYNRFPNLSIFIIPTINPDGFALAQQSPDYADGGRLGRFNAQQVDLNRNFPTPSFQKYSVWNRGKEYSETAKVYCGEAGGSEPEIQAIVQLCTKISPALLMFFHSVGPDITINTVANSDNYAKIVAQHTGYPIYSDAAWKQLGQTGTAKEWTELLNVSFLEIELSTRYGSHWTKLKPALSDCLNTLNIQQV